MIVRITTTAKVPSVAEAARIVLRRSYGDRREGERHRRKTEQQRDDYQPGHGVRTRVAFAIGRILAALGAVFIVATCIVTVVSFANADNCQEPDCDDFAISDAVQRALVLMPVSVFIGAAGVALVHDTYRKV